MPQTVVGFDSEAAFKRAASAIRRVEADSRTGRITQPRGPRAVESPSFYCICWQSYTAHAAIEVEITDNAYAPSGEAIPAQGWGQDVSLSDGEGLKGYVTIIGGTAQFVPTECEPSAAQVIVDCTDCSDAPVYVWDGAEWDLVDDCDCDDMGETPAAPEGEGIAGKRQCGTCETE